VLRYEANTDLRKIISYLESKLFKNEDQPVWRSKGCVKAR
jgi:hypothetical protein